MEYETTTLQLQVQWELSNQANWELVIMRVCTIPMDNGSDIHEVSHEQTADDIK